MYICNIQIAGNVTKYWYAADYSVKWNVYLFIYLKLENMDNE